MTLYQKIEKGLAIARDISVVAILLALFTLRQQVASIGEQVRQGFADVNQKSEKQMENTKRIADLAQVAGESKVLPISDTIYDCSANNTDATCVITNPHEYAATACFVGTVTRKDTSVSINTITGCTGRMEPRSTVKLEVPFNHSRVSYICPRDGMNALPDWDKCSFTIGAPAAENAKQ